MTLSDVDFRARQTVSDDDDLLAPARGVINGLAISLVLWIAGALVWWLVC